MVLAALEWQPVVLEAVDSRKILGANRYFQLRYAGVVLDPQKWLSVLYQFSGLGFSAKAMELVNERDSGRWNFRYQEISVDDIQRIESVIEDTLSLFGYT